MEIIFNAIVSLTFIILFISFIYYKKNNKRTEHFIIAPIMLIVFVILGSAIASLFENNDVQKAVVACFLFLSNIGTFFVVMKTNMILSIIGFAKKHYKKAVFILPVLPIIVGLCFSIYIRQQFASIDFEEYVDTNGEDDFSLQSIDESSIITMNSFCTARKNDSVTSGKKTGTSSYQSDDYDNIEYLCLDMHGVDVVQATKVSKNEMQFIVESTINKGNCRISLVSEGNILYDFGINCISTYTLKNAQGKEVFIMLAGEDADAEITVSRN